ncbi:MAG: HepT-like ribonuclease domain-containing protein [Geodermatophilaceae bacterium]
MRRLGTEQVLIDASAEAVARAVGFRNVLVHQYTEVRNDRVLANLERLADLSDFVGQVARWIDDQREVSVDRSR